MKKILIAAAALSTLAAPAFAQTTQNVAVTGSVAKQCGLGNQSGGGTGGYTPTLALGSLVDGNGQLSVTPQNIGFGNVWCNGPASVSLSATALQSDSTAPFDSSSFVNKLDLIVDGTGLSGSIFSYLGAATQVRTGAPATNNVAGAFETGTNNYQKARVSVALPTGTVGNDRPVAGGYSGSITLTVSPTA